jgi:hypothetical protein
MFVCSRCGSSYNARHVGVEHCPRCHLKEGVEAPLAFKAFDLSKLKVAELGAAGQSAGSEIGSSTNTSAAMPSSVT